MRAFHIRPSGCSEGNRHGPGGGGHAFALRGGCGCALVTSHPLDRRSSYPRSRVIEEIDYRIRRSPRARHARVVVTTEGEVELVLPRGLALGYAQPLIAEKRRWIERTLHRFDRARASAPCDWRTAARCRISVRS